MMKSFLIGGQNIDVSMAKFRGLGIGRGASLELCGLYCLERTRPGCSAGKRGDLGGSNAAGDCNGARHANGFTIANTNSPAVNDRNCRRAGFANKYPDCNVS